MTIFRTLLVMGLIVALNPTLLSAQSDDDAHLEAAQKIAQKLKCHAATNAGQCHWIRGRLEEGNGTPAYRLWKIGSHHLFGIYSAPGAEEIYSLDNESPHLPFDFDGLHEVAWGEFLVCPIEPLRHDAMQKACIAAVRNIFKKKEDWP
jgi:hypothetical protein